MDRPLLYPDDIVVKRADSTQLAVIDRTPDDIDTHIPYPGRREGEIVRCDSTISKVVFRQFKKDGIPPKGTIAVRWRDEYGLELIPTNKVRLLDRSLLIGDIVKRGVNEAMSGCVINTFTSCDLQPLCDVTHRGCEKLKGFLPSGRFTPSDGPFCIYPNDRPPLLEGIDASELMYAETISEDELVVYKGWIGRVVDLINKVRVRLTDNCVVEIDEEAGEQVDESIGSFVIGDILKTRKGQLRTGEWIYGSYNPNTPPVGTVVSTRTVEAMVLWYEQRIGDNDQNKPRPWLESSELESPHFMVYDRSRRPTTFDDSPEHDTLSNSDIDIGLNLRVRFKDLTAAQAKYNTRSKPNTLPVLDRRDHLGYDLNVFDVVSFRTRVSVQWQDLTVTTEDSINLVPDSSIDDEHAVWPGEICHTLALQPVPEHPNVEKPDRVGVVQSVNAAERMASVCFSPNSYIHYTNNENLDSADAKFVISRCISTDVRQSEEISLYDIEAPAQMNVRRGDIVLINKAPLNIMNVVPTDRSWLGELVDTPLDGSLIVRLGAASDVRDVKLSRQDVVVAVRSDKTDQADAWDWEQTGEESGFDDDDEVSIDDGDEEWDSDGEEEGIGESGAWYENERGEIMDEDEVENEEWEDADDASDAEMVDAPEHQTPLASPSAIPSQAREQEIPQRTLSHQSDTPHEAPPAYSILEGDVPADHHYRNEPSTETSLHMKRTQREHKILRNPSALPDGVFVRTWETRLDLLRVLFIGPTETPYEHSPFVVDFYLSSAFPAEPPQVFFHSWAAQSSIGAIGRVNPNLYEDGKICLSILGTWDGNKGESWSAIRSTLLQVIVSLLGLVLVREPYYNEAGYEALQGTESSKRPSALYSERIFLRAKGFLITAISQLHSAPGLKGLEDIVHWLYRHPQGPRLLDATIREVAEVLQKSDGSQEPDGLTVLSKGACIPATRALERLRELRGSVD